MEAIVLAGGFGTRLKTVINGVPKPMAMVGDRPFLTFLLSYLKKQGIGRVILSTGYRHEVIEQYYGTKFDGIELVYSREEEPLGTGGAVKLALSMIDNAEKVFVMNGDTFFPIELMRLAAFHHSNDAEFSLALKSMQHFDRYGTVETRHGKISNFQEKKYVEEGSINGGVYYINRTVFDRFQLPNRFSLEVDLMQKYAKELRIYGLHFEDYFIDIGIPEDYLRAQSELAKL